jgi:hypothetical protein
MSGSPFTSAVHLQQKAGVQPLFWTYNFLFFFHFFDPPVGWRIRFGTETALR